MGVVYEAEDLKLGRHVALKMLSGAADPAALERFWREARAASALNHPGICTLYEINESQNPPFLVMELLEGQSLDRLYSGYSAPLPRLIELGVQIADALDAAHRKGILHRDIKPANIFVTNSGQTKILDFGLARFEEPDSSATAGAGLSDRQLVTTPGSTLGTIAYMSPEQARGEALDARSDVFSLGVVLYEMGTGRHPFQGTTTAIVFDKLLNYMPPAPVTINHELPPEFENILVKALEKDRDLRYQSAADLRADLRRLQRVSSAARVVASGVGLGVASAYPGMTRSGSTTAAVQSAPPASTGLFEDPPPLSVQFGSNLDVSASIRASTTAPPEPPPSRIPVPLPRFNRQHFRYALLGLTGIIIIFSLWARFFHHSHARAVPIHASAAAPTPTASPVAAVSSQLPATADHASTAPTVTVPERTSAAKPLPANEGAARKARENAVPPKPANSAQHAVAAPPPAIQILQPPTAPPTSASASPAPVNSGTTPAPSHPATPATTSSAAASHPAGVSYSARHMHSFPFLNGRSCDGTLELTANSLIFTSDVHPVTLTRAAISGIDGNTVIETGGKKWKFEIYGMSNTEVHNLLIKWWNGGH